jgi:hypothetical protein
MNEDFRLKYGLHQESGDLYNSVRIGPSLTSNGPRDTHFSRFCSRIKSGFQGISTMCDFCDRTEDLPDRFFLKATGGLLFLLSLHTQRATPFWPLNLMMDSAPKTCPQDINEALLRGLETAPLKVTQAIRKCYDPKPKDILLTSLRGDESHFHIHLVPLWPEEKQCWRRVTGCKKAHLMEFLGSLEKRHDFLMLEREAKEGRKPSEQRAECTRKMSREIEKLREFTGYKAKA